MKIETFLLERWMTRHELHVEYDICESGIYPLTVDELLSLGGAEERERLLRALLDTRLGYSEAPGSLELRSLLAATYSNAGPENILVTTGAIEANFLAFNTLLEPGDHVVAVHPAYQQLYSVPRAIGCDVTLWRLRPEHDFRYDLDELETLLRPETKLIVINTPHNPTGSLLAPDELARVYELATARGSWVLSDEAYRWLDVPGGAELAPPARNLGDRAISVGTFSKPFGLPGLRTGWLAGPAEFVAACWALRDFISLSPGKLNDALAIVALRHREALQARTRAIVAENLATAGAWFETHREFASWTPPRGGLLALMQYSLDMPSDDLADRLAEEYSVMLAPGAAFDYEGYLRIGIGTRPDIFRTGLERAAACFADLRAGGVASRSSTHPGT
jgi:aspartate/methionine/tyrosine aminotransferase